MVSIKRGNHKLCIIFEVRGAFSRNMDDIIPAKLNPLSLLRTTAYLSQPSLGTGLPGSVVLCFLCAGSAMESATLLSTGKSSSG